MAIEAVRTHVVNATGLFVTISGTPLPVPTKSPSPPSWPRLVQSHRFRGRMVTVAKLTEAEFQAIVDKVTALGGSRIAKVATTGFNVGLVVYSASKKRKWHGAIFFDPDTGNFTYRSEQPHSNIVNAFARHLGREIDAYEAST